MKEDVIEKLTSKDDKEACAFASRIISESAESNEWYDYFDEFVSLLSHPKSFVRNRALYILSANARWDRQNKFESVIDEYLSHVTDDKPITSRQCVKALAEVGKHKPGLVPKIVRELKNADLSRYKDSMRPLIEKDIADTIEKLNSK